MKKGDLSRFIERAVQKEVLAQTVAEVQTRNVNVPSETLEADIDDALRRVRAHMWGKVKARKPRTSRKAIAR